MSTSPAFQFYAHDFLAGRVATYDLDEIGAYSLLLAFDWSLNGLPLELERLAKLCRVSRRKFLAIWETIGEQFPEDGDRRRNPRLKLEREKQEAWREKSSAGGKASAEARAKGGSTIPNERLQPNGNTPSPTPSPGTTPSSSAREAMLALAAQLPTDSDREVLAAMLARVPSPIVWIAEMRACLAAMPGHVAVTPAQLGEAVRDFVANNGQPPNMRLFRRYLESATRAPRDANGDDPFLAWGKREAAKEQRHAS